MTQRSPEPRRFAGRPGGEFVESPPHVDAKRMRDIDTAGILDALDLNRPDLAAVSAARRRGDPKAAMAALLDHLVHGHRPRPIPDLRERLQAAPAAERATALAAAEKAAAEPRGFTDPAFGRSELYGFHYLTWTTPLLEAYAVTGEGRWANHWAGVFDQWYDSRHHVHGEWAGLDVVWYTLGVAQRLLVCSNAIGCCAASLPTPTRVRVLATLLGGCRWLAEEHDTFRPGNWQFVGACALLRAAALWPEFRESASWADLALTRVEEHLTLDVYDDGGHLERAPSYHALCLTDLQDAVLHARAYLGVDLSHHPRFAAMHDWLIAMSTPEGWVPPLQDSPPVHIVPLLLRAFPIDPALSHKGVVARLADATEVETVLAGFPGGHPGQGAVAEWRTVPETSPSDLHHWLPGSKYVVARSSWDPGGLYAAVNCGPPIPHELESHSHLAALDFVLWGHGVPLGWEAGGPTSYDDDSYHRWFQAPESHNQIVVDGRRLGYDHDATVEVVAHTESLDVLRAYHDGWDTRHHRTFCFVRPGHGARGYWFVADELADNVGWRWFLHGRVPWSDHRPGVFTSRDGPGLVIHAVPEPPASAGSLVWDTSTGRTRYPSTTDQHALTDGELHTLQIRPPGRRLTTFLLPFEADPPDSDASHEEGVVRLALDGIVDEVGNLSWLRRAAHRPVAAMAWHGGQITDEGGRVLSAARATFCHARWQADRVLVDVDATHRAEVAVRAPGATQVRVAGITVPFTAADDTIVVTLPQVGRWTAEVRIGEPIEPAEAGRRSEAFTAEHRTTFGSDEN